MADLSDRYSYPALGLGGNKASSSSSGVPLVVNIYSYYIKTTSDLGM